MIYLVLVKNKPRQPLCHEIKRPEKKKQTHFVMRSIFQINNKPIETERDEESVSFHPVSIRKHETRKKNSSFQLDFRKLPNKERFKYDIGKGRRQSFVNMNIISSYLFSICSLFCMNFRQVARRKPKIKRKNVKRYTMQTIRFKSFCLLDNTKLSFDWSKRKLLSFILSWFCSRITLRLRYISFYQNISTSWHQTNRIWR